MGLFIKLKIEKQDCLGVTRCGKCIKVCPVGIFKDDEGVPGSIEANEDECILCDLCLENCEPKVIVVEKLYEA